MNPSQRQSGYVLLTMLVILIGGGGFLVYSALNQSPQILKHDQTERHLIILNDFKQRLMVFGWDSDLFCAGTTKRGYLPSTNPSLTTPPLFGFDEFAQHPINYTLLESTFQVVHNGTDYCADLNSKTDNDACTNGAGTVSSPLVRLSWATTEVTIYRYELCGSP